MWDFKFSAAQYYNFFRQQKRNSNIQINIQNPNDQWFMQQHIQLTPVKQTIYNNKISNIIPKQIINIKQKQRQSANVKSFKNQQISKFVIENNGKNNSKKVAPKQNIEKLKRNNISDKNVRTTSNSEISFKYSQLLKQKKEPIIEHQNQDKNQGEAKHQQTKRQKISKTKSQPEMHLNLDNQKYKVRMPCPYARKIQRDWQCKSNKSWYSLSERSAKKAMQSMKKIAQKKVNNTKKDSKPRFKF